MPLPTNSALRKDLPITSGFLKYFPDAIAAVARLSKIGNDKHNPGEPLHWAKEKSGDELECLGRHLTENGTIDTDDGVLHDVKMFWRSGANLQRYIDKHGWDALWDEKRIAEVAAAAKSKSDAAKEPHGVKGGEGVIGLGSGKSQGLGPLLSRKHESQG